ncbi:MAG TPA: PAS domain-containing protein, partial [Polyangiaceae bacterium]|nr:PAS domain-containing protein [Polyangiaceae bacterium]
MADRVAELETELARVCAERDELARRLKDAERYRTAVDVAQIPIMCVSAIEGRYLFANQAFANAIGWTVDEILSGDAYQIWLDVTHPDDLEVERRAVERLARGEADKARHEKRLVHRNGQARWYAVDVTAVRAPDGRLESIIVQFTDVHEQRDAAEIREQLEAELRQKQKLEALGKLAGGVAHDFNNRLVIIMGYTELLKRSLPEDGTLAQHADMVLTSAQRAAELTHQLLAYSRRQVLMPRAFDLNETVDRMRRLLERLIGEDIQLVTSLAAEHPIFGDPGQIEQVI